IADAPELDNGADDKCEHHEIEGVGRPPPECRDKGVFFGPVQLRVPIHLASPVTCLDGSCTSGLFNARIRTKRPGCLQVFCGVEQRWAPTVPAGLTADRYWACGEWQHAASRYPKACGLHWSQSAPGPRE